VTVGTYLNMLKQLKHKPAKMKRFDKFNTPKKREFGRETKRCTRCGNPRGHVGKYGINLCRRCFRETASRIGFTKYS